MKAFLVSVKVHAPYPITSEHTIRATSVSAAAARALRAALAAKNDGVPVIHKRRIESYQLTIRKL